MEEQKEKVAYIFDNMECGDNREVMLRVMDLFKNCESMVDLFVNQKIYIEKLEEKVKELLKYKKSSKKKVEKKEEVNGDGNKVAN